MIQAVERAAEILRLASAQGGGIRLCDLARASGLNRNTVYNLAETLVKEGFLSKSDDSRYAIGVGVLNLAEAHSLNQSSGKIKNELIKLHMEYPDSSIFYSEAANMNITVKMHLTSGKPGVILYPEGSFLPPYLTVGGVIFFAFADEGTLNRISANHPFDFNGSSVWGSVNKFMDQAREASRKGFSETPKLAPAEDLKIGVPVWRSPGKLAGAVTFHLKNVQDAEKKKILDRVLTWTEELNNK
jgi:DNA-binding IclR family transcriptional regulator